jgi:2-polyprenyl-3-methyl-5-hydroxy-6-metoxy-1,4-benzoquinol methylase
MPPKELLEKSWQNSPVSVTAAILERTFVYRAWQAPFAEQKFAPIAKTNEPNRARRVLDVACGPGTNTRHFTGTDYLGVDVNEQYIRDARKRHRRDFVVADVRQLERTGLAGQQPFDFILVNSFLHHLNTNDSLDILASLDSLLAPGGHIHILELVLPKERCIARLLARWDRGHFARPLPEWQTLFSQVFDQMLFEPYPVKAMGTTLWNMVYFKGKSRK